MWSVRRSPRPLVGLAAGLVLVAAVTALLAPFHSHISRASPALALVLPVVVAGLLGGRLAPVVTAVAAAAAFTLAFIPPVGTFRVHLSEDVVAWFVFVIVALIIGDLVAVQAERRRAAEQRAAETEAMHARYEAVVAERERLMEETNRLAVLERVDEQRAALLRSVSHDLRTPLASIRAVTTDLRDGVSYTDATRNELLDLVAGEAERLDRLVANLLSLSRIEAGALQPDRQAVAVDELITDRISRLDRVLSSVRLQTDVATDLPLVDVDYVQMDQVLTNLLENAARYAPPGSSVRISAHRADSTVTVSVTDEGPGINQAEQATIFEPFRRATGSSSTGIGLAICKAIVEAHGGHIAVENLAGGGACFSFTLPVHHG
jgi:two-component system sensor histidine kinase KdpD